MNMNIFKTWIVFSLLILGFLFIQVHAQEKNAQPLWQIRLEAGQVDSVSFGDSVLYYVEDDQLHVIDIATGKELWQYDHPIVAGDATAILPVFDEGLAFVPKEKELLALDERTGDTVWTYQLTESFNEVFTETFNQTGISYGNGYIFIETGSHLTALEAKTGELLWQTKKPRVIRDIEVLNDVYVVITSEAILEKGIGHRPHESRRRKDMYGLTTGQFLWTFLNGSEITKVFNITNNYVDTLTIFPDQGYKQVSRQNLETGEIIAECDIASRGSYTKLELEKLGPIWPELLQYPEVYTFYENYLYVSSSPYSVTWSVYRIATCDKPRPQEPKLPEAVSETVDRYLLENVLYEDIQPFSYIGGPLNGYFLFWKGDYLYKVPVPKESFTYLYHNKTDDSVYIAPKFNEIDPSPYEHLTMITGKVIKAGLSDKNLIIALLEDGTLQVVDFDSLETVFMATTDFKETSEVRLVNNILLIRDSIEGKTDMVAFKLPL